MDRKVLLFFLLPLLAKQESWFHMQGSSWKDIPVVVMSSENVPSRISM